MHANGADNTPLAAGSCATASRLHASNVLGPSRNDERSMAKPASALTHRTTSGGTKTTKKKWEKKMKWRKNETKKLDEQDEKKQKKSGNDDEDDDDDFDELSISFCWHLNNLFPFLTRAHSTSLTLTHFPPVLISHFLFFSHFFSFFLFFFFLCRRRRCFC